MISKDGVQIIAIEVPGNAQSVSIISAGAEPIILPISMLDDTRTQLAVAPIPARRDAAVISVLLADGTESTIGLPRIPERGWSIWQLLLGGQ